MTDKQIIIDGCDVSKCIYFQQEDDEYTCGAEECNGAIVACRACDNCYYKQLKRSEAQCEAMFVSHTDLEKKYKAKEQECERLKEYLAEESKLAHKVYQEEADTFFTLLKAEKQLDQLKAENEHLSEKEEEAKHYLEEAKKFKNCLTEIKEIAYAHKKDESVWNPYRQLDKILQKISECEGNDE